MTDVYATTFKDAPSRQIEVKGGSFTCRDLSVQTGLPAILLNHPLAAIIPAMLYGGGSARYMDYPTLAAASLL